MNAKIDILRLTQLNMGAGTAVMSFGSLISGGKIFHVY
jgi:hypothetical protein